MPLQTLFQRIIQEQETNLFLKNFTEKMIASSAAPGLFIQQLKAAFGEAINSQLWLPSPVEFSRSMIGRFEKEDTIDFLFSFRYDPMQIRLQMVELDATLNGRYQRIYPIRQPHRDLPPAGKVHNDLSAIRDKTEEQEVQQPDPRPASELLPSSRTRIIHP